MLSPEPSSAGLEAGSPSGRTRSWTRLLAEVDLGRLSPQASATRLLIGDAMTDGFRSSELAAELGLSPSYVSELLSALRQEILLGSGRFLVPLADEQYEALKADIGVRGVRVPIVVGRHVPLIDGRHRLLCAEALGLTDVPCIFVTDLDEESERELAFSLNTARRHLNRAQRETLVRSEIARDPSRSSRRIAAVCGVDHKTVEAVRRRIAAEHAVSPTDEQIAAQQPPPPAVGEIPTPGAPQERRVDTLGRSQPARKPPRPTVEEPERPLGFVECAHGKRHALFRQGSGYRIEGV